MAFCFNFGIFITFYFIYFIEARQLDKLKNVSMYSSRDFHCNINHTHHSPASVHELRPEDIKVVGAIGDSLTAGMALNSRSLLSIFVQYRGQSFTMGGADNLDIHATMPNILKKFSPLLTGYSIGVSGSDGIYAGLNVAIPEAQAEDMPFQARKLVDRMKRDKRINFDHDWKIVTVFIGGKDICDHCQDLSRYSPAKYKLHLIEALDYLKEHSPRTFVNLLEVVDASAVMALSEVSSKCRFFLSTAWCKCPVEGHPDEIRAYVRALQKQAMDIAQSGRYDDKSDFAVVLQPFLHDTKPPTLSPRVYDMTYFAVDCFHFSAKGHAELAVALWNNMLEPIGLKKTKWNINQNIKCPTKERPFLCTKKNCQ